MPDRIDSFRFLDFVTKQVAKAWIAREPKREPLWTPLEKPIRDCTVAVVSSAGIALKADTPFDQEGERVDPWWGDPSFRVIPRGSSSEDVEIYHLHVDPSFGRRDLNCVLPLQRLDEMAQSGEIGGSARRHYSFMGYQVDPRELLEETTPEIVGNLREDGVDVVLLVPI